METRELWVLDGGMGRELARRGAPFRQPDWSALAATAAQARLTLVIYMGVKGAAEIQRGLLDGLPASTPVAVVQSVSLPQQRQALTTLGALCETLAREQMASPAIIVVGDVLAGLAVARSGTDRALPLGRAA